MQSTTPAQQMYTQTLLVVFTWNNVSTLMRWRLGRNLSTTSVCSTMMTTVVVAKITDPTASMACFSIVMKWGGGIERGVGRDDGKGEIVRRGGGV
jgi:hypothetical protein